MIIKSGLQTINLPETTPYHVYSFEKYEDSWYLILDMLTGTKIDTLAGLSKEEAEQIEWTFFLSIKNGDQSINFDQYLADYQNGAFALNELKPEHLKIASWLPMPPISDSVL